MEFFQVLVPHPPWSLLPLLWQTLNKPNLGTIKPSVELLRGSTLDDFTQVGSSNIVWQAVTWPAPALVTSSSKPVSLKRFTFCRLFLTLGSVGKPVRAFITLSPWALVDVYSLKVHFGDCNSRVYWILNVPKLSVPWENVDDRHHSSNLPSVGPATVKVWPEENVIYSFIITNALTE